jgi:hypothetical protein
MSSHYTLWNSNSLILQSITRDPVWWWFNCSIAVLHCLNLLIHFLTCANCLHKCLIPIRSQFQRSIFYFVIFIFTCMYTHCLSHLPLNPQHSPHAPPHPNPAFGKNLFHPLVLWFCWRENISGNKKDIVFLLVWDKDSYTERFLASLPCICVLQPTLVHLYQTSSLLPGPLPIVASASLRLLYSLLYGKHINHIQVLGFLPFPYSSHAWSSISVWPMSNNITAFVLDL